MTPSDDPERSPFEILGVDYDVDDREVRRAYAAKIREARRSGDAELARTVQDAFEAIRDSDTRSRVRKLWESRSKLEPLLEQGEAFLAGGHLQEALSHFLGALDLVPDSPEILGRVAGLELSLLKVDDALRHVVSLVRLDPNQGGSVAFLAHTLATRARLEPSPERAERFWDKAWSVARRARALGASSGSVVVLESQILWNRSQPEKARSIVAEAVRSCRELRSSELHLLVALLRMDTLTDNQEGVTETLGTIRALLPEDEARRGSVLETLCEFAVQAKVLRPKVALACLELVKESSSENEWVAKEIRSCKALDRPRRFPVRTQSVRPRSLPSKPRKPVSAPRAYSPPSSGGGVGSVVAVLVCMFLLRMCY